MGADSKMKTVDVIIPLYNGAKWIRETLDSALGQSYKPNKIIVVDDGSTDGSKDLIYNREDILLLQNPAKGVASSRNFGFEHSTADFVAFLDQDDIWHPDHLKLLIEKLNLNYIVKKKNFHLNKYKHQMDSLLNLNCK